MEELNYHIIHIYLHLFALPSEATTKEWVFFKMYFQGHTMYFFPLEQL